MDLLGLNEGNYEFQARLVSSGTTIRTATGFFRLREPGMVGNLADSLHPGVPVLAYTQQDSMLVFDGLFPLGLGDSVSLDVFQNGQTVAHYDPIDARIDLGALAAGDYSFHVVKIHDFGIVGSTPVTRADFTGTFRLDPLDSPSNLVTFAGLLPLGTGEAVTLEVTDAGNTTTSYPLVEGRFDMTVLAPGQYSLRAVKTLTETSTQTVPPYYAIQAGDSWSSIAVYMYGNAAVAGELQAALGNPPLTAGDHLTGLPPVSRTPPRP